MSVAFVNKKTSCVLQVYRYKDGYYIGTISAPKTGHVTGARVISNNFTYRSGWVKCINEKGAPGDFKGSLAKSLLAKAAADKLSRQS